MISVPNKTAAAMQIRLMQVLYTPMLGYTLVSIGHIDKAGYTATFTGGKLIITDRDGGTVGTVPKSRGLYLVTHMIGSANTADHIEKLTIMELHRRLGHIAPQVIRKLVSGRCLRGVALVPSDEPETCEVCI